MKLFKYIIICAGVLAMASCNEKKAAMEPEEVVEAFCRSVAAGDFSTARALCDTVSMKDYLENYQEVMNSLQKEDSCALAIASEKLSGADFEVTGVERNGDARTIQYRLAAGGHEKTRKAAVKKEEGEWKVAEITDAI